MSLAEKELASRQFSGIGSIPPEQGAVPVLFGLRLITNPRMIWVSTSRTFTDEGVRTQQGGNLPLPSFTPGATIDESVNRPFVALSVLCHGEITNVHAIWCNSRRLQTEGRSLLYNKLIGGVRAYKSRFKAANFFREGVPLIGHCAVFGGGSGDNIYTPTPSVDLLQWDGEGGRIHVSKNFNPPDRQVLYTGLAVANLYINHNAETSFQNWSFLTERLPQGWQEQLGQILIDEETTVVRTGGEIRERHYVLAIDASPIMGMPVQPMGTRTSVSAEFLRASEFNRRSRPIIPGVPGFSSRTTAPRDITHTMFKYRYDLMREGVLKVLDNLRAELLKTVDSLAYRFSIRIVVFGNPTQRGGDEVEFRFEHDGMMHSHNSDYQVFSSDRGSVNRLIDAAKTAVMAHRFLRPASQAAGDPLRTVFCSFANEAGIVTAGSSTYPEQITRAYINQFYRQPFPSEDFPALFDEYDGVTLGTLDWSLVFEWVRLNAARFFGGYDQFSLPQISILTGGTWPAQLFPFRVNLNVKRDRTSYSPAVHDRYALVNVNDLYRLGREGTSSIFRFPWRYGLRSDFAPALDRLRIAMGLNSDLFDSSGSPPNRQMVIDYQVLDPFCWGDAGDRWPVGSSGSRDVRDRKTYSRWTNFPATEAARRGLTRYSLLQGYRDPTIGQTPTRRGSYAYPSDAAAMRNISRYQFQTNCTASIDSDVIDTLGTLGSRMQAVRVRERTNSRTKPFYASNPAHIIRECLLNPEWGRGNVMSESDIDDASFLTAAQQLYRERFGLGFVWDRQSTISHFINNVLRHIDGVLYENNNKIYLRLLGAPFSTRLEGSTETTYWRHPLGLTPAEKTAADNNQLTIDNVQAVTDVKMPREDELVNRVIIQYTPYNSLGAVGYAQGNDERIRLYGLKSKTFAYDGILNESVAGRVAARDLTEEEAGLVTATIAMLPPDAESFNPGDVVVLTWPELNLEDVYFRVMRIVFPSTRSHVTKLKVIQTNPGTLVTR